MKRKLKLVFIVILVMALSAGLLYLFGGGKTVGTSYESISHPGEIQVKWDRKWGVLRYDIYRIDITGKIYVSDDVPFDKYDKVGSVSGLHGSFDDKSVENGHYYAYVIRGYGRDRLVCDSFDRNIVQYECAGLAKPDLIDNGYGENNMNSAECLYLLVQLDGGMKADGIEVYRKAERDGEFALIEPEKLNSEDVGYGFWSFEIEDTSVKPGTTYTYKVRTYADESGQHVVSEYSDTVKMYAVNFIGQYKINEVVADPGGSKLTVTVKSDKNNSLLKLDKGAAATLVMEKEKGKQVAYGLTLNSKTVIKAGEKKSLAFTCKEGSLPVSDELGGTLEIEDEGISYDVGVIGYTLLSFDLDKGTGTVFVDWDN